MSDAMKAMIDEERRALLELKGGEITSDGIVVINTYLFSAISPIQSLEVMVSRFVDIHEVTRFVAQVTQKAYNREMAAQSASTKRRKGSKARRAKTKPAPDEKKELSLSATLEFGSYLGNDETRCDVGEASTLAFFGQDPQHWKVTPKQLDPSMAASQGRNMRCLEFVFTMLNGEVFNKLPLPPNPPSDSDDEEVEDEEEEDEEEELPAVDEHTDEPAADEPADEEIEATPEPTTAEPDSKDATE